MGKAASARQERGELGLELSGFALLAVTAFCLLSVYSFGGQAHGSAQSNLCGPAGHFAASLLVGYFGIFAAYAFLILMTAVGSCVLFRLTLPRWRVRLAAMLLLIIPAISITEWCFTSEPVVATELRGGYVGEFFGGLLDESLQKWGTRIVLGMLYLVGFLLITDILISPYLWKLLERSRLVASKGAQTVPGLLARVKLPIRKDEKKGAPVKSPAPPKLEDEEEFEEDDEEYEDDHEEDEYDEEYEEDDEEADEPEELAASDELEDEEDYEGDEYEEDEEDGEEEEYEDGEILAEDDSELEDDELEDDELEDDELEDDEEWEYDEDEEELEDDVETEASSAPPVERNIKISHRPTAEDVNTELENQNTQLSLTGVYSLPPTSFLDDPNPAPIDGCKEELEEVAQKIEATLASFKIEARVENVLRGPVITQYEVSLAAGIKVHKIVTLADDLAMALSARSVRVVAPIPGKNAVGIEVPNRTRETVTIKELLVSKEHQKAGKSQIPLFLGKNSAGTPIVQDLARMPHLLIAGATGSGKSVCINSIITSMLMTRSPDELKLILVDPKMVELYAFEEIPHLLTPVVTDMKKAPAALDWLCRKMDDRYQLLSYAEVRNIASYNQLDKKTIFERMTKRISHEEAEKAPEKLPYIVIIIDELADLMMTASKEVEASIIRLSQKSRAVGIHVILATQRPSVDVITGLIKANMPCRISFQVAGRVDSRTIIDTNGAEKLLGEGDMLFLPPGSSQLIRSQGTYISDSEIRKICGFLKKEYAPQFSTEIQRHLEGGGGDASEVEDDLFEEAVRIILKSGRGSVSLLQRRLSIGYTRASRLMDIMGDHGLVGPFKGSKAREVFMTLEDWEAQQAEKAN